MIPKLCAPARLGQRISKELQKIIWIFIFALLNLRNTIEFKAPPIYVRIRNDSNNDDDHIAAIMMTITVRTMRMISIILIIVRQ